LNSEFTVVHGKCTTWESRPNAIHCPNKTQFDFKCNNYCDMKVEKIYNNTLKGVGGNW